MVDTTMIRIRMVVLVTTLVAASLTWADSQSQYARAIEAYNSNAFNTSFEIMLPLAEEGNANAQNLVGTMYFFGQGVNADKSQAARWYKKAAKQGLAEAQYNLGNMYRVGWGLDPARPELIKPDIRKAIRWYRKAAKAGDVLAQRALGDIYSLGHDVPKDIAKAVRWYKMAADQGDPIAKKALSRIPDEQKETCY